MATPTKAELQDLVLHLASHLDTYTKREAERYGFDRTPTIEELLARATKAVPLLKEVLKVEELTS